MEGKRDEIQWLGCDPSPCYLQWPSQEETLLRRIVPSASHPAKSLVSVKILGCLSLLHLRGLVEGGLGWFITESGLCGWLLVCFLVGGGLKEMLCLQKMGVMKGNSQGFVQSTGSCQQLLLTQTAASEPWVLAGQLPLWVPTSVPASNMPRGEAAALPRGISLKYPIPSAAQPHLQSKPEPQRENARVGHKRWKCGGARGGRQCCRAVVFPPASREKKKKNKTNHF